MNIIFLDMDGVLCTFKAHEAQPRPEKKFHGFMEALDREAIGLLNKLHTNRDVQYVLSSTWRKQHNKEEMLKHLRDTYGWTGTFHEDWATPVFHNKIRGDEIQDWLDRHKDEVDNFIILDDNDDMLASQMKNFIQTDEYNGLSVRDFWQAENIFGFR